MQTNGNGNGDQNIKSDPKIEVFWNAEHQSAGMKFETKDFKTWDFVVAVLEMAVAQAKFNANMGRAQGIQNAQMQAVQDQQLKQRILGR